MLKNIFLILQIFIVASYASDDDVAVFNAVRKIVLGADSNNDIETFTFKAGNVAEGFIPGFVVRKAAGDVLEVIPWSVPSKNIEIYSNACLEKNGKEFWLRSQKQDGWLSWVSEFIEGDETQYWGRVAATASNNPVVIESKAGFDSYNTIIRGNAPIVLKNSNENGGQSHVASLAVTPINQIDGMGLSMLSGVFHCNDKPLHESLYGNAPLNADGLKGYSVVGSELSISIYGGYEMLRTFAGEQSKL